MIQINIEQWYEFSDYFCCYLINSNSFFKQILAWIKTKQIVKFLSKKFSPNLRTFYEILSFCTISFWPEPIPKSNLIHPGRSHLNNSCIFKERTIKLLFPDPLLVAFFLPQSEEPLSSALFLVRARIIYVFFSSLSILLYFVLGRSREECFSLSVENCVRGLWVYSCGGPAFSSLFLLWLPLLLGAAASLLQRDLDVPPEGAAARCEEANFLPLFQK